MKCEQCGRDIKDGQAAVPVGTFRELNRGVTGIFPDSRGIHLDCLTKPHHQVRS